MGSLRLILAISVVIAHAGDFFGFKFTGALVAVEIFFIISGFYMTMILDKKYMGKGSYSLFLSNRFLRLYPMYWVVLLAIIIPSLISFFMGGDGFKLSLNAEYWNAFNVDALLFLVASNLLLFGQDIVMFLGFSPETGVLSFTSNFRNSSPMIYKFLLVPQAWSLGIEVTFYIIAPLIVRRSNLVIISLIIISLSLRGYIYFSLGYKHDPWTYRFFPTEFALFLFGTVSYRLYETYEIQKIKFRGFDFSKLIVYVFFFFLLFYQFIPKTGFGSVIDWVFYGICTLSIPFIFEHSKASKLDSRIGELSYPIYITHIFVISLISSFLFDMGWQEYKGELGVLFTLLVSYILVKLVADPIEKVRQARTRQPISKGES